MMGLIASQRSKEYKQGCNIIMNKLQDKKALLIVGGYGTVGTQVATILRQRHPKMPIIIAGRDVKKQNSLQILSVMHKVLQWM
jgi:glutamyl-tRNA reductase